MINSLGEDLKKLILAGIGAVAMTAEKSKKMIDDLVEKGEITIEQGKILNGELKHDIKGRTNENAAADAHERTSASSLIDKVDQLTPEELGKLKEKIAGLEKKGAGDGGGK